MRPKHAVLALALLLLALPASAQGVVMNPRAVEFEPSADHDAVREGAALVTRYELRIYLDPAADPVLAVDIGKPPPIAGKITVSNPVWFAGLTPKTKYVARVVTIGPSGEGVSDPSNSFGNVGLPAKTAAPTVKR